VAHKCPACSADVPGVLTQEDHEKRLKAKSGEIELLRAELTTSADKAGRFDQVESERARLAGEVVRLTEGASRTSALAALGIHDPREVKSFSALYASDAAGLEEPPSFADWLAAEDGARANPLLAPKLAAAPPGAPPAPPGAPPAPPRPGAPPVPPAPAWPAGNTGAGPVPPGAPKRLTPSQLRTMFQSMTPAQVDAWKAQHGANYGLAPAAPPAPPAKPPAS